MIFVLCRIQAMTRHQLTPDAGHWAILFSGLDSIPSWPMSTDWHLWRNPHTLGRSMCIVDRKASLHRILLCEICSEGQRGWSIKGNTCENSLARLATRLDLGKESSFPSNGFDRHFVTII